jgi:hypothetical protein
VSKNVNAALDAATDDRDHLLFVSARAVAAVPRTRPRAAERLGQARGGPLLEALETAMHSVFSASLRDLKQSVC